RTHTKPNVARLDRSDFRANRPICHRAKRALGPKSRKASHVRAFQSAVSSKPNNAPDCQRCFSASPLSHKDKYPSSVPNGNPGMVFARVGRHGERKLTTKRKNIQFAAIF